MLNDSLFLTDLWSVSGEGTLVGVTAELLTQRWPRQRRRELGEACRVGSNQGS